MINLLIPLGGSSTFFNKQDFIFPKPLIEIGGKSMIQLVIENLMSIKKNVQCIFVVNAEDCQKFYLDNVLKLLTKNECKIVKLQGATRGASCSALMAIEHINNEDPLIISNGDQLLDFDINEALERFEQQSLDAATITFESVHPRWSYVRLDEDGSFLETAEKRPISKNAIAGFYYFSKGTTFIKSAMRSIEKDVNTNGQYFIAPVMNELILEGKRLGTFPIKGHQYHTFYSPQKIEEYEKSIEKRGSKYL